MRSDRGEQLWIDQCRQANPTLLRRRRNQSACMCAAGTLASESDCAMLSGSASSANPPSSRICTSAPRSSARSAAHRRCTSAAAPRRRRRAASRSGSWSESPWKGCWSIRVRTAARGTARRGGGGAATGGRALRAVRPPSDLVRNLKIKVPRYLHRSPLYREKLRFLRQIADFPTPPP
eukprot:SAG31_NODE_112_length_24420_cov_19.787550_14_plen_178_part_00